MSDSERQARYVAAQERLGLKRVRVWVPVEEEEALRDFAQELQDRHMRKMILGDPTEEIDDHA